MSSRRCFRMIRMLMDEKKARQVREVKAERLRKKEEVEELESMVRLRQAESDMFRTKAVETWAEARRLKCIIAQAKTEKPEQDFVSLYLKRRLEKVEAEKQRSLEKIEEAEKPRNNPNFDMFKAKVEEVAKQWVLQKKRAAARSKLSYVLKNASPPLNQSLAASRPPDIGESLHRRVELEAEMPRNYPEFRDMLKARNEEAEKRRRELLEAAKQWL